MRKRNIIFLTGTVWEVVRFALLYLLLLIIMNPSFNIIGSILLVWFGTLHLLMACCFFFLWLNQDRYSLLLPFITLGKGLNILPALLIFIMGTGLFQLGLEFFRTVRVFGQEFNPSTAFAEGSMGFLFLLSGIILFFDLIFFFIVLSYTLNKPEVPEDQIEEHLPEWKDIHVEEE